MYQEWCAKPALVEMPTLNVLNRNRAGERKRLSRIDITKLYFRGLINKEGNRYLLDRLFFVSGGHHTLPAVA
jgi:hypothetical protein